MKIACEREISPRQMIERHIDRGKYDAAVPIREKLQPVADFLEALIFGRRCSGCGCDLVERRRVMFSPGAHHGVVVNA
jgi:hypothetical protein